MSSRSFDGTDDVIRINDASNNFSPNGPYSLMAWYRTTATGTAQRCIVSFTNGSSINPFVQLDMNTTITGRPRAALRTNANQSLDIGISNASSNDGRWHHLAMTRTSNILEIIFNGVSRGTTSATLGITGVNSGSIGARLAPGGNPNHFLDNIKDVHLYNRNLSVSEINQLMYLPGSISKGLVGYWPVQGEASPENDYSGFHDEGTVSGAIFSSLSPPVNGMFNNQTPNQSMVY